MRTLRNLLEHEYRKPNRKEVSDAIGIAELFVQACAGKMKSMVDGIGLGSGLVKIKKKNLVAREFYITFDPEPTPHFELTYWNREQRNPGSNSKIEVSIGSRDCAFLIPNPWTGSARILAGLGFEAFATSSVAAAATYGRRDGKLTRDEALASARSITQATDLPVSADLENGFGDNPSAVAETVRMAAEAGLVGCSIEDSTGDKSRPFYDLQFL